jgi:hypothetical protein
MARKKSLPVSSRSFQGVLFVHPPNKYWLTREELRRIRTLRRRRRELISGILVDSGDSVALYPVHFNPIGGRDMAMEYDGGFIYWLPWSALAVLLSRGDERRGPAWW